MREDSSSKTPVATFDYRDLNAYLLVVVGLAKPQSEQVSLFNAIISKVQQGGKITIREVQPLCKHVAIVTIDSTGNLSQAIETLGSGIHRLIVTNPSGDVGGILSQLRVVDFFWNEGINFPTIDRLYPVVLRDLAIGSRQIISVK